MVSSNSLEELFDRSEDPWPHQGMTFQKVTLEVVVDGDDQLYSWLNAPSQVAEVVCAYETSELIHQDDLPIASGLYEMDLEFWYEYLRAGWDDPDESFECGFYVTNFRRLEISTGPVLRSIDPSLVLCDIIRS